MKRFSRGFTIIELMIVVAIIGIIAAILYGSLAPTPLERMVLDTPKENCYVNIPGVTPAHRITEYLIKHQDFELVVIGPALLFKRKSCNQ